MMNEGKEGENACPNTSLSCWRAHISFTDISHKFTAYVLVKVTDDKW